MSSEQLPMTHDDIQILVDTHGIDGTELAKENLQQQELFFTLGSGIASTVLCKQRICSQGTASDGRVLQIP